MPRVTLMILGCVPGQTMAAAGRLAPCSAQAWAISWGRPAPAEAPGGSVQGELDPGRLHHVRP